MTGFRIALWQIFVAIAILGAALAALRSPTPLSVILTLNVTLVVLVLSLIGAATLTNERRAFCLGFAIAGGIHLLIALLPKLSVGWGDLLLTRYILDAFAVVMGFEPKPLSNLYSRETTILEIAREYGASPTQASVDYVRFIVIGQSLMSLLVGIVGGCIGHCFFYLRFPIRQTNGHSGLGNAATGRDPR